MLLLLPCPDHYRVGIKAGPSLVGMTLTEHTALMTARLVSSGAGPVLRCVRADQIGQAGQQSRRISRRWPDFGLGINVSGGGGGAGWVGPGGCWCPPWPIAASMSGRCSQLVR